MKELMREKRKLLFKNGTHNSQETETNFASPIHFELFLIGENLRRKVIYGLSCSNLEI